MIEEIQLNYKIFKDRSTVLYGASDTGKSTVIKNILLILKEKIQQIVVFVGNEDCFQSYKNIVPNPLIHRRISKEILEKIWKRQEALMCASNRAKNISILSALCLKISDAYFKSQINDVNNTKNKLIHGILQKYSDNDSKKKLHISKTKSLFQKHVKKLYLDFIRRHFDDLNKLDLSVHEKYTLKYFDMNPRILIIMDDLMHQLKSLKGSVFEDIFFQGRHKKITFILSLQDDKGLPSELRKNSFINIFTTRVCATSLFNRPSNNYDNEIKKKAKEAVEDTFSSTSNQFQKLLHVRKNDLFFRFTANIIDDNFTFVPPGIEDFCKAISNNENNIDESNPYWDLLKN